jgi:Penicillin binding protein transpeptidase domain
MDAETSTGKVVKSFVAPVKGHVNIPDRSALLQGFEGVVSNPKGTAYGTFQGFPLNQLLIAGKTGTAQVGGANQDTSVFTSFGPATNPDYVIDAFMEQSGYGASVAGPVVRNIWQEVLTEQQQGIPAPTGPPAVGQTISITPPAPATVPTTTTTTAPAGSTAAVSTTASAAATAGTTTTAPSAVTGTIAAPTTLSTTPVTPTPAPPPAPTTPPATSPPVTTAPPPPPTTAAAPVTTVPPTTTPPPAPTTGG